MRWGVPAIIIAFAAILRFWALSSPTELVFDELYYVRDAVSQLAYGYPTKWPDDDSAFDAYRATQMLSDPSYAAHPPLGKWLISLGIMVFGAADGVGWRSATAVVGLITVVLTMRLGWKLTRSWWVACVAGLILAVDGVHVTLSRVSLLDGHLTMFIVLGALAVVHDHEWAARRWRTTARISAKAGAARKPDPAGVGPVTLWRPWLFVAAAVFGLAAGVKWSGLYSFAGFLVLILIQDLFARRRLKATLAWVGTTLQALLLLVPVTLVTIITYVVTWSGWLATSGGWGRSNGVLSLFSMHVDLLLWHSQLSEPHTYASHPLTWPLGLRPTGMFYGELENGMVSAISPLPNPLIALGATIAILGAIIMLSRIAVLKTRALTSSAVSFTMTFILTGYLSAWLPWVLTFSRSAVFQFYAVALTPFAALMLAYALAVLTSRQHMPTLAFTASTQRERQSAVSVFLIGIVVLGLIFWPMWSGIPQPEWFWKSHLWLPGWR